MFYTWAFLRPKERCLPEKKDDLRGQLCYNGMQYD